MKKIIGLFLVFLFSTSLFAQYVQPESAIWDNINKRYYITNAGAGTITMRDWSGKTFTSWAIGLIQPKAMLIIDSTLYVVDYTTMKTYNMNSARLLKNETVPGATFMNDICMDNDGNFYITETYDNSIIKYDTKRSRYTKLALKGYIQKPNGIIFDGNRLVIVSFRPDSPIQAISLDDYTVSTLVETEIDYMDGITKDGKGNVYFSAWNDQNSGSGKVYRMKDNFTGEIETVITNLDGPADIYYNQLSDTLVVPNMDGSYVQFYPFINPPPTPKLIQPANGSHYKNMNYLEWTKTRAAKSYAIQIDDNYAFSHPNEIAELPYTYLSLEFKEQNCDSIWWRVKAVNSKGKSDWSKAWFMIPPLPIAPIPLLPEDEATDVETKTTFTWQYMNREYVLVLDTTADFSSAYKVQFNVSDSSFTLPVQLLPDTKYYWMLKNTICGKTAEGPVRSFTTIDRRPPGKPELMSPENGAKDLDIALIQFIWKSSERTDYYVFRLKRLMLINGKYEKVIIKQDTMKSDGSKEYKYKTDGIMNTNNYYWTVRAYNQYGVTESDEFKFETEKTTGVEELNPNGIKIIPQPASSWVKIELPFDILPGLKVELVDSKGTMQRINYKPNGNTIDIKNIDEISSGLYLLRIINGNNTYIKKLIINH